jgi:hypothetical protein
VTRRPGGEVDDPPGEWIVCLSFSEMARNVAELGLYFGDPTMLNCAFKGGRYGFPDEQSSLEFFLIFAGR